MHTASVRQYAVRYSTVRRSVRPSVCPSVRPPARPFVRPPVRPSVRPSVRPFRRPSVSSSICVSAGPSICLFVHLSIHLSVCPSLLPLVFLSVRPTVFSSNDYTPSSLVKIESNCETVTNFNTYRQTTVVMECLSQSGDSSCWCHTSIHQVVEEIKIEFARKVLKVISRYK